MYIEQNTYFEVNGEQYWSGGAIVNDDICIGYLGKDGYTLTNWAGDRLGDYAIKSTWKTPKSYVSSKMHQVEVCVFGKIYTGRSAGIGMLFKGKRKKLKTS